MLEELERLSAEATRGPWVAEPDPGHACEACGEDCSPEAALLRSRATTGGVALVLIDDRAAANGALIAAMRNALPELIAAAREKARLDAELLREKTASGFLRRDVARLEAEALAATEKP